VANFPGPYEVRVIYSTAAGGITRFHELRLSMDMSNPADPGDAFDQWTTLSRLGATPQLDTWVDALVVLLQPIYHTSTDFISAELWEYSPASFDAEFRSSYVIGEVGTNASAAVIAGQAILTFRSLNGSHARINLMESSQAIGPTQSYPTSVGVINNLFDFIVAQASPVIARDNGYLFNALKMHPGQNEALFKAHYR
jgi:hypothetical protein